MNLIIGTNLRALLVACAVAAFPLVARAQFAPGRFAEHPRVSHIANDWTHDPKRYSRFDNERSIFLQQAQYHLTKDPSLTKKTFPKRTLIGAALGGALGLGVCVVFAEGPLTSDRGALIGLVTLPAMVGGLIGYSLEKR